MTHGSCGSTLFSLSNRKIQKTLIAGLAVVIFSISSGAAAQLASMNALPDAPSAQQSSPQPGSQDSTAEQSSITIPAGTRLNLVLTHSVDSRSTHSGDQISAEVTAPVILGSEVVIPAGAFVQGKAQKLTRKGTQAEMLMQSVSLVFPNGYIADAGGPVNIESDQWTAANNPSGGSKAAIFLVPLISMPIGALIGSAADSKQTTTFAGMPITTESHKGLVIGTTVGFGAGLATSFALIARSHDFYIVEGAPLSMRLPHSVTLDQERVNDAVQNAPAPPPVPMVQRQPAPAQSGGNGAPATGPGSCTAGQEWCNGQCRDSISFVSDSSNCGRCGNQCSISESCTGGSCSCGPGYTSCMGQCKSTADFVSDNQNCGSCGNSCGIGESCFGGSCRKI